MPALLLTGLLYADPSSAESAKNKLISSFGPIALEGPELDWDGSDYYKDELGSPIKRKFLFYENPVSQTGLAEIKHETVKIEKALSSGGKRTVNIDPGYMTGAKLVLASHKDFCHRIPIGGGVFAEVTLMFVHGEFVPHPNTYRDFLRDDYIAVFREARQLFIERIKKQG